MRNSDLTPAGDADARYSMFSFEAGKAEVGIAMQNGLVAIHLPSSGGSTNGHRNPGRPELFELFLTRLEAACPDALVVACRHGRSDTPTAPICRTLRETRGASLRQAFRAGGNFRFDFWVRHESLETVETVAKTVGLFPGETKPIRVLWPAPEVAPPVARNAWRVVPAADRQVDAFRVTFNLAASLATGIEIGDGVVVDSPAVGVTAFGRVYRKRSSVSETTLYFDGVVPLPAPLPAASLGLAPSAGPAAERLEWNTFATAMTRATGTTFEAMPILGGGGEQKPTQHELAYLRDLMQLATVDDLLGPAGGPTEEIVGMGVRDRYLVGKLAPREPELTASGEPVDRNEVLDESDDTPDGAVPNDLRPLAEFGEGPKKAGRWRLPGEELPGASSGGDPEESSNSDLSESKNQSFVPSSVGLTVCIDHSVQELELVVRWGRYARLQDHDYYREIRRKVPGTDERAIEMIKERVWRRIPAGGTVKLPIVDGRIRPLSPDPEAPEVRVHGTIRPPLPSGARLVSVFIVNDQTAPKTNKDEAWVFQPELVLRDPTGAASFRRRPHAPGSGSDRDEEDALEMLYRRRVEFGVGHGISVHASPALEDVERATEVATAVMPQYEVAVTETPGLNPKDRSQMRRMMDDGYLDMKQLAKFDREALVDALSVLSDDYATWIVEQRDRTDLAGHEEAAKRALARCDVVSQRLKEGIGVLETNDLALAAFRFANEAMANQRLRSIYALRRRRGEKPKYADIDVPKNRSWRPFQLAFVLLSIPALTDPGHRDRTNPIDGVADLIWFPTGGGKTEAYLGVAAFTMAIRRMKPSLGGLDGSRGLSVIMRYTLRLLTLQQFQRASTLVCAMEVLRRQDTASLGETPFSIGLWVGSRLTPNRTEDSHFSIEAARTGGRPSGKSSPAQLTNCPWCGAGISAGRDIVVRRFKSGDGRTILYCGDKLGECDFSRARSTRDGLPVVVVDEELYRRPPSMLIATVDKFAMMAWRGQVRNLFGRVETECPRHGLLWPGAECTGNHPKRGDLPSVSRVSVSRIRPPDLIIQDEFHLISGPLGTMVGLYETAVDKLSCWKLENKVVRPKIIASTATVRKAADQVNNVFLRQVGIFPPHGLDIEDNFFSVQRPISEKPGRRYLGICAPGSARPAILIRLYTALLTSAQELFDHFGPAADPWMTVVGYFNSLRELGGMRRLAEDDVQTRAYRVQGSSVRRPGLAQRDIRIVDELTSRVSGQDIPKKLDHLEVPFQGVFDAKKGRWTVPWKKGETRAMDIVLATNMLSVGVDVNRIGLMAVNGQPKNTAEYIQATSRVGRAFPGLVCTVLTWSRPRDLSHYETFEHYHATFYRHVEAQSVTPFAPRALDRGLTGAMLSWLRLSHGQYNPNLGASEMNATALPEAAEAKDVTSTRGYRVTDSKEVRDLTIDMVSQRLDRWVKEANKRGRKLGFERGRARKKGQDDVAGLLKRPGVHAWDHFTVPMSLREVEPGARLVMLDDELPAGPDWEFAAPTPGGDES